MPKLKTTTYTTILFTLALVTGCSQSDTLTTYEQEVVKSVVSNNGSSPAASQTPISFDVYAGEQGETRTGGSPGVINSLADLAEEGFSVFAYYTKTDKWADAKTTTIPNFMYNQHVTGTPIYDPSDPSVITGYSWPYSPMKYWPNNENEYVTFFAYGSHADVTQQADATEDATGLSSGIVAISGNARTGAPYLWYDLGTAVSMSDMRDLLIANVEQDKHFNQTKQKISENITFNFRHALAAFGFSVRGNFNSVGATNTAQIYDSTYIRIESIQVKAVLPHKAKLTMEDGEWTPDADTSEITFGMEAAQIAENLRYTSYSSSEEAAELLSNGVGRDHTNNDTPLATGVFQKVGLTGSNRDNLFYFIPASSNDAITFTITIKYHTLTRDARMLYGIGDVVNEVTNTLSISNLKDTQGKMFFINMILGMDGLKFKDMLINNNGWYTNGWNGNRESGQFWVPALEND